MADYPDSIFEPRETENLPGLSRSTASGKNLKQNLFSEDYQDLGAEISAIETTLGTNPEGEFETVDERITELEENPGGGASAFTDLTDVPNSYEDQAGKIVAVNAEEDGLEFVTPSVSPTPRYYRSFIFWTSPSTTTSLPCYYAKTGGGTCTMINGGYYWDTSGTASSTVKIKFRQCFLGSAENAWDKNPDLTCLVNVNNGTNNNGIVQITFGDYDTGSSVAGVLTAKHMGFLLVWVSGSLTVYASNANGTNQKTTNVSAYYTANNIVTFYCKQTSGNKIEFYIDGVLCATHTDYLPSGATGNISLIYSAIDGSTTDNIAGVVFGYQWSADVY